MHAGVPLSFRLSTSWLLLSLILCLYCSLRILLGEVLFDTSTSTTAELSL
eukprot:Gb_26304 [translate_table: standard]